ncbi:hypothetical protein LAZ67_9001848 [Cordylochernes scorpioides]|uniref:RNase H type-1 domain-containing protein n=1 Tax=Cordylochernes scorpioides TaxID=51811 RepID=A0ABY6KTD3_9ARAC|nr:hypothetical protein LAZ67_9001848 [Cordylochernes scorpioides]
MKVNHLDVKTAFLHGDLDKELYMELPEGLHTKQTNKVCKLKKAIYGQKQAGRSWNTKIASTLIKNNFKQSIVDPYLFTKNEENHSIYLILYVDDMLLASDSEIIIQNTVKTFEKEFEIKNLGDPTQFIGIGISRNREGELLLSQKIKIQELVERYNLQEAKPTFTPMESGYPGISDVKLLPNNVQYQQLIGSLLYLSVVSRPDIAAPVCILSSRNQNPRNCDWNAAKRIVRYLKTTKELELRISNQKPPTLEAYSDATWASDNTDRKSLSGNLFLLGSNPISWMTGQQGCVSLSSTEAELISAAEASQELLWLLDLLKDLELEQKAPIYFHQDNQSCLKICSSEKVSSRTKHVATKIHHLKDLQKKTVIKMIYCPTGDMKADILTKPLPRPTFEKLRYNLVIEEEKGNAQPMWDPQGHFINDPCKQDRLLLYLSLSLHVSVIGIETYSLESRRQNKNNLDRHFGSEEPEDEISLTTCGLVDPPFSENEVKLTAFKFGKRKSSGPEGIDNTVVKALVRMHPSLLSRLFDRLFEKHYSGNLPCLRKCTSEELHEGDRLVLYADDQFLIIETASRAKAEKCVETSLQIFSIWAHDSGLKFNVSKTKALSFKPRDIRSKRKHKPAIRMEGRRVALVNRMTILGVVIDDKMSWQYQAEEMVARGREALGPTGIGTEVFTDGSKSGTNTGAGVVIFTNGELIFQEGLALRVDELVFSAELVAIRVALRVCAEKNFSPDRLYSDCMSALVVINLEKGQLAHQIIQELEMMTRAPELPWFRRHSLIEGNEFADRIAKAGCFRGRSLRTPRTKKEVYRRIRGHVKDLWLDRWRNSVKGREVVNGVTTPKYLCMVMSHKLIRVVRDMGSSPSLHRFKIKRNPDCVYGERDVNARHYVLDCPRVVGGQEERRRARGAIESKLLRNHSKLLEKAHDVAAELFLSCTMSKHYLGYRYLAYELNRIAAKGMLRMPACGLKAMAAALQKFDIDPEQQLYTPKIVDIAADVMEMHAYGDAVMSRRRIFEWYKRFKEGREETAKNERSGRPSTSTTPERPKKARKAPIKVKVMLTVFFYYQGIVHHEYQQQGSIITADSYLGVLRRLRETIRQKQPEL